MKDLKKLAMVPAYNEGEAIEFVISELGRHAPGFDVLVIDDGSTDDTAKRAEAAGATVVRHPFNLGIGGAVQSGFKHARRHGYDVAVQVDGDGQHDPRYLEPMLEKLHTTGDADMVCGTRFRGSEAGYAVPRSRRLGIRIFRALLSRMLGESITDPTSGFRMTNRHGIELFARDYPHDYPEVEAIIMLHAHKLQLHEFPVRMRERDSGVSSIGVSQSAYYMVRVTLALAVGLFRRRPLPPPGEQLMPGLPAEDSPL
jgi:glycosyltransferase involved in cell wall biosynthesis